MIHIITLAAALLPALLLMRYFVKKDRFPEPTHLLVKTFLLGLLITIPIVAVELVIMLVVSPLRESLLWPLLMAFVVAGFTEEFFKLLVLHRYCATRTEFDEPMDAVVYAVVASLGFACVENVLYVAQGGIGVAVVRALTAVPAHAALGALMGYYYARQRFGRPGKARFWSRALWLPVLLHGLYDAFPMVTAWQGQRGELPIVWLVVIWVPFLLLLVWLLRSARAIAVELRTGQLRS